MSLPQNSHTMGHGLDQPLKQVHTLVMPWPAQGHINPMVHLSTHLARHGVMVTFLNTQLNHDRLVCSQQEAGIPLPSDIHLVAIPDGLTAEDYNNIDVPKHCQSLLDMEPLLEQLLHKIQPPVTCVIADIFVLYAVSPVVRRCGIRLATFWTQSAGCYAAHFLFTQVGYTPPKENCGANAKNEHLVTCIPGCPPLRFKEVPSFLQPCDPSHTLFSYLIRSFREAQDSSDVLINTFDKLEPESLKYLHGAHNICAIGPILPLEYITACRGDEDDEDGESLRNLRKEKLINVGTSLWVEEVEKCMTWLDKQEPQSVLYVSFGSLTLLSGQQITEVALGLEACGHPMLMVVRPGMLSNEDTGFSPGYVERMGERACFVSWAPQLNVLAHPAVGGFFTHGGWNSFLEAILRGLPMLCWPYIADQMLNTRCMVDVWKVGLELKEDAASGLISKREICGKIKCLMDSHTSEALRKQAAKLKVAAQEAVAEPHGSSYLNLQSFAQSLLV